MLYSTEMAYIKTLHSQEEKRWILLEKPQPMPLSIPFAPVFSWDVLVGDQVAAGHSGKYEFFIMDVKTGQKKTVKKETGREEITGADKKAYFDSLLNNESGSLKRGASAFTRKHREFPRYKPAYRRIFGDYRGNILVFLYSPPTEKNSVLTSNRLDVFDKNGGFINRVTLDTGLQNYFISFVAEDEFWTVVEDETSDLRFVKYKMAAR